MKIAMQMNERFQHKYRIPSARLQTWDYKWAGAYFVTTCTKDRACYFGDITDGIVSLSPAGLLADVFWHEIKHHTTNIELGAFVVMPNHIHGILILHDKKSSCSDVSVETGHALSLQPDTTDTLGDSDAIVPNIGTSRQRNPGKNSISSIVGAYKSAVKKHANRLDIPLVWQPRFHDHIIRDANAYERITAYIITNPAQWADDEFYPW
jgi:putative transposase